jgi:hypothetical protein
MTNPSTKPETAPATVHIKPAVAPATDTIAKVAPLTGEHKDPVAGPPKS